MNTPLQTAAAAGRTAGNRFFDAMRAADQQAAEHQRVLDENAELHCRVQKLEAERDELLDRIEERGWDHKDDKPRVVRR